MRVKVLFPGETIIKAKKKSSGGALVFLPGLGADHRLFHHQVKAFKGAPTPAWIPPLRDETLAQYAQRWAKRLKLKKGCVLVGVSFGGMLALEMAKWVSPKAVFLVGSCRTPASVPFYLRLLGGIPIWPQVAKVLAKLFPRQRGWFLGVEKKDQLDLLMRMFFETPDNFLRWTVKALRGWGGVEEASCPVRHIHGRRDRLIPCRNVKPDQVIADGGHTIVLTHSKEVNDFIRNRS